MAVWGSEEKTILLVLGYPALRRQVGTFVRSTGVKVLSAPSGAKGLDIASRHSGRIDLLVSELRPPDMPSPELVKRIRTSRPSIPALVLSPEPEDVLAQVFGHTGVTFLETPFSWSVLAERLSATLG